MRRVKKTTSEQFDLLKAEMAVHPAAARGYGVGAQRSVVDAEWKEIVNKLNALGPPERTLPEWKKVWSDVRLRIKRQSMKKPKKNKILKKPQKEPINPEEDQLMEALNSTFSIYGVPIKTEQSNQSYDNFEQESHEIFENEYYDAAAQQALTENPLLQPKNVQQTVVAVEKHMDEQNQLMQQLIKVSSTMSVLMDRHLKAVEKKTSLMERQLKLSERHNVFLRRQEARR